MEMNEQNQQQEEQEEQQQEPQNEMYYDVAELKKLKYVKVTYNDFNNQVHEICTEVKFMGNALISLYFKQTRDFYIDYPQDIIIKFITSDAMFVATALLHEVKKSGDKVYLSVVPPQKMVKQQNRKYSRVNLDRSCVLVIHDNNGDCTTYLSRTVNLSASGVLIRDLETMFEEKPVEVELSQYDCYHLILFLERDMVYKLFSRYVRHDRVDESHRYAFHYLNTKPETVAAINKYVTEEQIQQLKRMQNK